MSLNLFSHIDLRVRELGDATEFYRAFLPAIGSPNSGKEKSGEVIQLWEPFRQNHFSDLPRIRITSQTARVSPSG
jgi:hypothetical protein